MSFARIGPLVAAPEADMGPRTVVVVPIVRPVIAVRMAVMRPVVARPIIVVVAVARPVMVVAGVVTMVVMTPLRAHFDRLRVAHAIRALLRSGIRRTQRKKRRDAERRSASKKPSHYSSLHISS